jgi:hypothetical protein
MVLYKWQEVVCKRFISGVETLAQILDTCLMKYEIMSWNQSFCSEVIIGTHSYFRQDSMLLSSLCKEMRDLMLVWQCILKWQFSET